MTEIDFYFHAEDKLKTGCKLSAKAVTAGERVFAFCPDEEAYRQFDRMLWTTPAIGFVPHCGAEHELAGITPIIVGCAFPVGIHDQILLNLGVNVPEFFSRFQRLIEIVTIEEADRQNARERYKFYRDRGYEIRVHDLSQKV